MSMQGDTVWAKSLSNVAPPLARVLIFSHISDRDGATLIKTLAETLKKCNMQISHVILSTYKEKLDDALRPGIPNSIAYGIIY